MWYLLVLLYQWYSLETLLLVHLIKKITTFVRSLAPTSSQLFPSAYQEIRCWEWWLWHSCGSCFCLITLCLVQGQVKCFLDNKTAEIEACVLNQKNENVSWIINCGDLSASVLTAKTRQENSVEWTIKKRNHYHFLKKKAIHSHSQCF